MLRPYYWYITNGISKEDLPYFGQTRREQIECIRWFYHRPLPAGRAVLLLTLIAPLILQWKFNNDLTQFLAIALQVAAIIYYRKGIVICKSYLTHSR